MNEVASGALAGLVTNIGWEGLQTFGRISAQWLKEKLIDWAIKDEDMELLVRKLNEAPDFARKTEKYLSAYIDDDTEIQDILKNAAPKVKVSIKNESNEYKNSPVAQGNEVKQEIHYHMASEAALPKKP